MKICFLIDARSPIALNWVRFFVGKRHDVHIISSYPCTSDASLNAFMYVLPVAFSGLVKFSNINRNGSTWLRVIQSDYLQGISKSFFYFLRYWLGPLDVFRYVSKVRCIVDEIKPDLFHAMRIPFEGLLAAEALRGSRIPFLISVWGNDFTLFGKRYPLIATLTRRAMQRADALHCDCFRDLRLAYRWGFQDYKPATVLPGAGGVQTDVFYAGPDKSLVRMEANIPSDSSLVVINPRGFRSYVRNDIFFRAIPRVLQRRPDVMFLCSAMKNNTVAENWLNNLGISHAVRLLPTVSHEQMADFFRLAQVTVSPSVHDGTPNTLLEAMACGCFPVAGDIESVREWITDGVNGLLCDPTDPESLAKAILCALDDADLRQRARRYNLKLVAERAGNEYVMEQAEHFYYRVVEYSLPKRKMS